jgi:hypothetical protein
VKDSFKQRDDSLPEETQRSEVGDLEDAGETTAADTIKGPTDTRPVGADTMLKVSDDENQKKPAAD